ncbi:MAG: hypothetical protein D6722_18780, partial [Bacteroidetes bacterium]
VKGWPILGSTLPFLDDPLQLLIDAYRTHGPVFKVKALTQTITMMAGLEANTFLAQHANELLSTAQTWGSFKKSLDAETLLVALDGEPHAGVRKAMARGYSPQMIGHRLPKVVDMTREILHSRLAEGLAVEGCL